MSPSPTLPLFPTLELRFSDEPESVEPEVPMEAPALALSTQFIFGPAPPPATTTTKTPPKTTKRQRAAALRRKKAAAALREKKADAAARERDPNYHPLNLNKDYHLILNPPRIDPKIPATPKPSDDREPSSRAERKRSREKGRSASKRPSSDIAEDSGSSERPLKSDDESYTPSGKGNKKKKSCTERQERRLQPGEVSSGGTNTSSRGTDDEPQLIRGLLSDSPLSSHPLSTDRFISLSKPRGSVKERPCRRGNVQSMYTPLKEFLYKRHGDDSPRRKGYSREEQHVEEEEKKISALRSQLESRMRALEAYVATASKAAGDFQTYDTICTEDAESKKKEPVKGRSKDGGAVRPVNKRKRRRRIGR
ncbi:hypothetical protein FOZ63_030539 [Perkinsus olseni]|uniref:Uncharacterized protein n=2 Tax=Perkinsus olseni TaxID=32597 RepID=A0A7J6R2P1_PEROL|nr:hypothetical protein FOZ63_030539 [Perkinsus olseni]